MEIPYQKLDPETLRGLIESFVLREGTDYGEQEYSLQDKVEQVHSHLKQGLAAIVFDEETESCSIVAKAG